MKSRAHVARRPLHPMLITLPLGALITALVFDVVYLAGGDEVWWRATLPLLVVGLAGGVLAAVPGLIDLATVARRQGALKLGLVHAGLNLLGLGAFLWSALSRGGAAGPPGRGDTFAGFWLDIVGVLLLVAGGSLGWSMVYHYHVGVLEHPEAFDPEPGGARPSGTTAV